MFRYKGYVLCSYPSSLYTVEIVFMQDLYLISPSTGCGPWIRLLATSNGMLATQAKKPAKNPIVNLDARSFLGSWEKIAIHYYITVFLLL